LKCHIDVQLVGFGPQFYLLSNFRVVLSLIVLYC